jgi:hypothetical protein
MCRKSCCAAAPEAVVTRGRRPAARAARAACCSLTPARAPGCLRRRAQRSGRHDHPACSRRVRLGRRRQAVWHAARGTTAPSGAPNVRALSRMRTTRSPRRGRRTAPAAPHHEARRRCRCGFQETPLRVRRVVWAHAAARA